jgi:hypothetical protein
MARKTNLRRARAAQPRAPNLTNNASIRPIARKKGKKGNNASKARAGIKPHHVSSVCSITDPFCPRSKGSKWPDGTNGNTMTEQFRGNFTVNSLAAGDNLVFLTPTMIYGILTGASSAAGVVTMSATTNPYKVGSLLQSNGSRVRIVSFGVIVRTVASATNAAGLVTFGTTASAPTLGGAYTLGTELYDEVTVKALQPGMELSWVSQPRGTLAHEFVTFSVANNVSLTSVGWTGLVVEISGATPSIPVLNIEYYINIEFMTLVNSALTAIATPNPPAIPALTTSTSRVHSSLGSFVEGGVKSVEAAVSKHAENALASLLDDPLSSLSTLFAFL